MEVLNLDHLKNRLCGLTHSILEPNGLKIKTPAGVVFTLVIGK